ncbi:hypothetical protein AKJ09_08555 [Labilithrix luteola]|uniref:Uncharacterized protein n=1 Tax=Labilithrix luteola TaxID=1391654 RepID=A0A0K1Q8B0_9BACT|nr:hypothetical protein AKJ09_08555 [Labilithrix luteola]
MDVSRCARHNVFMRESNRRIIERYFEEVWNQGKLDVLDELLTPTT